MIRNNASYGVNVSGGTAAFNDCEIRQNVSYGVNISGGAAGFTRCRILSNSGYGIAFSSYSGTITNCVIAKNTSHGIGAGSSSSANVLNCTITSNTSYGINGACAAIKNCIIWGNGDDLYGCTATYSCIEDQDTGTGVIHNYPVLVNEANDDYHLWYTSPCIDAGDPSSSYANEPDGGGGRIDMGAYGNTAEATSLLDEDADGIADAWERSYWAGQDPNLHGPTDDPDSDGLRNKDEYYIHWDPTVDNSSPILGLAHNGRLDVIFPSLSLAFFWAIDNDTLVLQPGTFYETINFNGKPLCLRSTDPNDPNIVAATIIDANGVGNGATFNHAEGANSVLDGLTFRHAQAASDYAGVKCTSASPTIRNCLLRDNYSGVYLDHSSSEITNCRGIYNSYYGLYIRYSSVPIITGGVYSHNGQYGAYFANDGDGVLQNCILAKNSSAGVFTTSDSTATIINCTVADHTTYGIAGASTTLVKNCVLWNNGDELYGCAATYSCVEDQDAGTGNIHGHPMFVDSATDDYHLWYISPAINAGDPSSTYANEPNGGGGRIDMGAYGNTAEAATTVDVDADGIDDRWETAYWPGQDPNQHGPDDDPDGDGLRNKDEYYVHWDPNTSDANSIIGLVRNSRVDVNYPSISLAAVTAANGDTLTMAPGTFYEPVNFSGKPVTLRSTDPNDPNVVAATIIDANGVGNGITCSLAEGAALVIDGLTIRHAQATSTYAGIKCTSASPAIRNCILRDNYSGIYLDSSSSEITNCQGIDNSYYGLTLSGSSSPVVSRGVFSNNGYYGV